MTFNCSICKTDYKSYKSLWNHNSTFHSDLKIRISNKVREYKCTKCDKEFTRKK